MSEIECLSFKTMPKGAFVGVAKIYIPKWGVEVSDIKLFQKDGKRWVGFPSKEYQHPETGEKKYAPYLRFRDKNHAELFSKVVVDAIEGFCDRSGTTTTGEEQMMLF